MTKVIRGILIIIAVLAVAFTASPTKQACAESNTAKSQQNNIKHTGEHGRNARVTAENGQVEIVTGTIFKVTGNTINMDGETFSLSGVNIHDQLGLPVKVSELYPGLKAKVVLKNGLVTGASVSNFSRGKVVTDPEEIKRLRQQEMDRKGR